MLINEIESPNSKELKLSFVFFTCNEKSVPLLKAEIRMKNPDFKLSFSRKNYLTYKIEKDNPDILKYDFVFSRVFGISFGKFELDHFNPEMIKKYSNKFRLHVWSMDPTKECTEFRKELLEKYKDLFFKEEKAENGDWIVDLIEVSEGKYWWGIHQSRMKTCPYPAGIYPIKENPDAPSRAYGKLAETVKGFSIHIKKEDTALEFGSAPGGAALYLLENGLYVTGVDPAEMDEEVLKNKKFVHINDSIQKMDISKFKNKLDWILSDMNVSPKTAIGLLKPIINDNKRNMKGLIFTLKLNHPEYVKKIPLYLTAIKKLGFRRVLAKQFSRNHTEIAVFASN